MMGVEADLPVRGEGDRADAAAGRRRDGRDLLPELAAAGPRIEAKHARHDGPLARRASRPSRARRASGRRRSTGTAPRRAARPATLCGSPGVHRVEVPATRSSSTAQRYRPSGESVGRRTPSGVIGAPLSRRESCDPDALGAIGLLRRRRRCSCRPERSPTSRSTAVRARRSAPAAPAPVGHEHQVLSSADEDDASRRATTVRRRIRRAAWAAEPSLRLRYSDGPLEAAGHSHLRRRRPRRPRRDRREHRAVEIRQVAVARALAGDALEDLGALDDAAEKDLAARRRCRRARSRRRAARRGDRGPSASMARISVVPRSTRPYQISPVQRRPGGAGCLALEIPVDARARSDDLERLADVREQRRDLPAAKRGPR